MARAEVKLDRQKLLLVADESPELSRVLQDNAREISNKAQAAFRARQVKSNEFRLSVTTPPKYIRSFRIRRTDKARKFSWIVENVDPAAVFVEYGAHAGGRTFVLRYYPLRTALIAQGLTE